VARSVQGRPKNQGKVKSKVKSMTIIFFDITKNSFLQIKKSIQHNTVIFYYDCIKICEEFATKLATKNSFSITTMHRLTFPFTPGLFGKKATWFSSATNLLAWLRALRLFSISHHFFRN
jgi:hypothetical protein